MTDLRAIAEAIAADSSCAQGEFNQRVLAILPYLAAIDPKPFNAVRELNEFVAAAHTTPKRQVPDPEDDYADRAEWKARR